LPSIGQSQWSIREARRDRRERVTPVVHETIRALAHAIGNQTEAACRRGSALERRRDLMNVWADYCEVKAANII
jgi:hypothetical protein